MDTPEIEIDALDQYYLWRKPRPGFTMFGSYIGRLVLTNRRLVFLSAGTNGILRSLFLGPPPTAHLGLDALRNRGSVSIRLENIELTSVAWRVDFASYLIVKAARTFTFMSKFGLDRGRLTEFQETIERERALRQSRHFN